MPARTGEPAERSVARVRTAVASRCSRAYPRLVHPFVRGWANAAFDAPPYLFPGDALPEDDRRLAVCRHRSLDELLESGELFGERAIVHQGLLPQPFLGDLDRASVFLLMSNPGFELADYYAEGQATFRQRLLRNIRGDVAGLEFPFSFLDPALSWHPGFRHWFEKLRDVIGALVEARGIRTYDALRLLARGLCVVEWFPYRCQDFGVARALVRSQPSVEAARGYVHDVLVPRARNDEITIVAPRRAEDWGLVDEANVVAYGRPERLAAHLTRRSRGGAAILDRIARA